MKTIEPYCCSQPSDVATYSQVSMPAFATRMSSRGTSCSTLSQNSLTDSNLAKSTRRSSTFLWPVAAVISIHRAEFCPVRGRHCRREFTFNCFLTLSLAPAGKDQSLGIHRRKMLCSLKSQPSIRSSNHDDLTGKIGGDERYGSGELLFQEREDGKLGHGEGVRADEQAIPLAG